MGKIKLNEEQKKAIEDLRSVMYDIRLKYYRTNTTVEPILYKMDLKKKNKDIADTLLMDLNTILKSIDEFIELIEVKSVSNELKNYDSNDKREFLQYLSERIDFIIFYMGRIAAQLEIYDAYQTDVRSIRGSISRMVYWFVFKEETVE